MFHEPSLGEISWTRMIDLVVGSVRYAGCVRVGLSDGYYRTIHKGVHAMHKQFNEEERATGSWATIYNRRQL